MQIYNFLLATRLDASLLWIQNFHALRCALNKNWRRSDWKIWILFIWGKTFDARASLYLIRILWLSFRKSKSKTHFVQWKLRNIESFLTITFSARNFVQSGRKVCHQRDNSWTSCLFTNPSSTMKNQACQPELQIYNMVFLQRSFPGGPEWQTQLY